MPSSTSSSDDAVVRRSDWRRVLAIGVLVFAAQLVELEWLARAQGHVPSIRDGKGLWSSLREQASDGDPETVVLLGASRMQRFDLAAWRARYPERKLLQLAVAASSPLPGLRHLSQDEDFVGTALCSLIGYHLPRNAWKRQTSWCEKYDEDWGWGARSWRQLQTWLQARLVLLDRHGFMRRLLPSLAQGHFPEPYYLRIAADRSYTADYTLADLDLPAIEAELPGFFEGLGPATDEQLEEIVGEVGLMVDAIVARGGQVVFLRFPTSGMRRELEEQHYPRARFWDALAAGVPAARYVHFEDHPELSGFSCPDLSHLDSRDTEAFTLGVADVLVELGVLE